jgi:hypothetical protein
MLEDGSGEQAQPLQMAVMMTANILADFNSHDLDAPDSKFRRNHPTLTCFG